uniref:SJCHGC04898 protein n=1 Tax=Schistosoma japonicum TaxID=6182 RepID=Q5DH02_SCHJA|nr:SJCHGC04898 protein [Schistosoma japonicum]
MLCPRMTTSKNLSSNSFFCKMCPTTRNQHLFPVTTFLLLLFFLLVLFFFNIFRQLSKLKVIMAGENDITDIPVEVGNIPTLHDLHLNNNPNLNSLPAELSLCSKLIILNLESCPLRALPEPIVQGGSAMIIYFLQQVLQLRRQQNIL